MRWRMHFAGTDDTIDFDADERDTEPIKGTRWLTFPDGSFANMALVTYVERIDEPGDGVATQRNGIV